MSECLERPAALRVTLSDTVVLVVLCEAVVGRGVGEFRNFDQS